jgi:hypothetical protein
MMTGDKILLLGAQDGGAYQVTDNFCWQLTKLTTTTYPETSSKITTCRSFFKIAWLVVPVKTTKQGGWSARKVGVSISLDNAPYQSAKGDPLNELVHVSNAQVSRRSRAEESAFKPNYVFELTDTTNPIIHQDFLFLRRKQR